MKEKVVFYTYVSDDYYEVIGTPILINSFKRFHSDIELVVYRQEMIDRVFSEKGLYFDNAKPTFAKLLTGSYDLVVSIDADTIITARLEEILKNDYEIGSVTQVCDIAGASIENVTAEMYVQAGMVASRNRLFWDIWEEANKDTEKYIYREQDILNLVWYNDPEVSKMRRKIFDKDKNYYGVKSLGREKEFYLEGEKLMCRGEQVFCYHNARGHYIPKLQFEQLGFNPEVIEFLKYVSSNNSNL